jgi:Tfp pilus assembly protein PilV
MPHPRGYALMETLLASIILASGLVSVASIFSVTVNVNLRNRQRTTATLLLHNKMEQLQATGSAAGGGLNPSDPVAGYVEYVRIADDGTTIVDNTDRESPYLCLWQVQSSVLPAATIEVFGRIGAAAPVELARATSFLREPVQR